MTTNNGFNNFFITPAIDNFTLVYYENNYNLWFEDTIVKTIEDVKKPTKRLSNKLLTNFTDYINNQNKFPKEVNEIYKSITENATRGSDGFRILKDLFLNIVVKDKKIENLENTTDRIKYTYIKQNIKETSSEIPIEAIEKLLQDNYKNSIDNINNGETKTIYIDCDILKKYNIDFDEDVNENLYTLLERKPIDIIDNFENILEILLNSNIKEYYIKFDYNGKETKITDLLSDKIGSLIKSTAVVKGVYEITPVLNNAVFECRGCMRLHEEKQSSGSIIEPSLCECGGRSFRLLEDESSYYNSRKILLEEPIEDLGNKTNPRNIIAILTGEGNFLNKINIGDRVNITGVLSNYRDEKTGNYNFYINGNNIEKIGDIEIMISEDEEKQIIELSEDEHIFEKLTNSTAPELMLDNELKQSLLCCMVGGGTVTNGRIEIHSLFISNPGLAKTDIFEWVKKSVEKCIITSGANSSGVGFTGAIDKDPVTGQNVLKAGALPLASGGICAGDEIDKLNKHEFGKLNGMLENGKQRFDKAGIHETLYCNSTFMGGANPKYERFDKYKSLKEQIVFPASFLSRMDFIFVFQDDPSEEIIDLILDRYMGIEIYPKENEIEHDLLKKYLYYAKHNFKPVLTKNAKKVARSYAKDVKQFMEKNDTRDIVEFTFSRFINSIARISGAIAKLHLRNEILESDVEKAVKLKNYCFKLMGFDIVKGVVNEEIVNGETSPNKIEQYQTIFNIINEEKEKEENEDGVYLVGYGVAKQFIKSRFMELMNLSERTCENVLDNLYDDNKLVKNRYGRYMYYDIKNVE